MDDIKAKADGNDCFPDSGNYSMLKSQRKYHHAINIDRVK